MAICPQFYQQEKKEKKKEDIIGEANFRFTIFFHIYSLNLAT
jgi:hypothetical protein